MDDRSTSGVLIGIIIVLVIGIIAWLAYTRGFFSGNATGGPSVQLEVTGGNVPGTPNTGDSGNSSGNAPGGAAPSY